MKGRKEKEECREKAQRFGYGSVIITSTLFAKASTFSLPWKL